MTNLEAKQEAIKKAYGECWELVKNYVDENGWIYCKDVDFFKDCGLMRDEVHYIDNGKEWDNFEIISWRLPVINRIENNNGWIRIESKDDLPKEEGNYFVVRSNNEVGTSYFIPDNDFSIIDWRYITHYQPIKKPKLPIY